MYNLYILQIDTERFRFNNKEDVQTNHFTFRITVKYYIILYDCSSIWAIFFSAPVLVGTYLYTEAYMVLLLLLLL